MKKLLLLAAVAVSSLTVNAQALSAADMMPKVKMQKKEVAQQQILSKEQAMKAPMRNATNDCWYTRPAGSMVMGFNLEGMGWSNAFNVVAPFMEFTLNNQCSRATAARWYFVNNAGTEYELGDQADENNNLIYEASGNSGYYIPHISTGKVDYAWGETNRYNQNGNVYNGSIQTWSEVASLRVSDPHLGQDLVGWGYLSTNFLYGDGTVDDADDAGNPIVLQSYAAVQDFEKPMSPLYVECAHISLITLDKPGNPLAEGEALNMDIMDAEGNTLYTLTCTPEDVIVDDEAQSTANGDLRAHTGVFTMKEVDPLSGELSTVPFVLDQAFTVAITGFEGKGIGLGGHVYSDDEAAEAEVLLGKYFRGYSYFYDVTNPEYRTAYTFQNPICLPITFESLFDAAQVWENAYLTDPANPEADPVKVEDFNVLNVSADGLEAANAAYPAFSGLQANTACPWFDEDENENYYFDVKEGCEYPDWILGWMIDGSAWESEEDFEPTVAFAPQIDALPEGVEGRGAKFYIHGRGIVSEAPVYILQGNYTKEQCDADEASGINTVVANKKKDNKLYSISGQQVDKNFKGIVINNGKKFLQK